MSTAPDFNLLHGYRTMYRYVLDMEPDTSSEVAEAYAISQGADVWLDDSTHPVWEVACDALENACEDMDAVARAGYEENA